MAGPCTVIPVEAFTSLPTVSDVVAHTIFDISCSLRRELAFPCRLAFGVELRLCRFPITAASDNDARQYQGERKTGNQEILHKLSAISEGVVPSAGPEKTSSGRS